MKKNLVLLGMMGVGKTTLGKIVAKKQGLEFIDIDAEIEKKNSMTVNKIFEKKGEKFFRKEEEIQVSRSIKKIKCVIALGGGSFINRVIRENILKNAISVWLDVDIKTLRKRIMWNTKRPLLKNNKLKKINDLYYERRKIYKEANYKIKCEGLKKESIVKKILTIYESC